MYSLLGVDREDKAGRMNAMIRNFSWFDAPVGIIVTIDKEMVLLALSCFVFWLPSNNYAFRVAGPAAVE
jgi:hypothetical protein